MSSSYYDSQSVGWDQKYPVGLDGYVSGYLIGVTAAYGIWLFALLGIAIWAISANRSKSGIGASVFKVHKFWLAIVLAIVFHIFSIAFLIVTQVVYYVTAAYILVNLIFTSFEYLTEVVLLAVVFSLLFQLLQKPGSGHSQYRGILFAHYAFCVVLLVLYLAIFGLSVRELHDSVFNEISSNYIVNGRPVEYSIKLAWDVLFALASLEVLVISVMIVFKHRNYRTNNKIGTLLIALIAIPLFVRRFFSLGYDIAYRFKSASFGELEVSVALAVIWGLCLVLEFAGLVAIGIQPDFTDIRFDVENRALPQGQFAASHAPPNADPYSTPNADPYSNPYAETPSAPFEKSQTHPTTNWKPSLPSWRRN